MRVQTTLALIALIASGTASADPRFGRPESARGAALYLEVPLGVRDRQRAGPKLGLRLHALPSAPLAISGLADTVRAKTLLDVPILGRRGDPLRESGAAMLLGKGAIVGIVVGAIVAVSVISDSDDDGGGGGY